MTCGTVAGRCGVDGTEWRCKRGGRGGWEALHVPRPRFADHPRSPLAVPRHPTPTQGGGGGWLGHEGKGHQRGEWELCEGGGGEGTHATDWKSSGMQSAVCAVSALLCTRGGGLSV